MVIMKLIAIVFVFRICLCQNQNGNQGNYFQILQIGLEATKGQQMMSSENIISTIFSVIQNNQNEIVSFTTQNLIKGLNAISPNDTDNLCLNHTELFVKALLRRDNWALKMIDAFGKPVPGILEYNFNWVGNYDQCIAIQATVHKNIKTQEGPASPYGGKYCTASFPLGPASSLGQVAFDLGLCVPDSCSQNDISGLVNAVAGVLPLNMTIPKAIVTCQEKSLEFSDKALAVTIVGALFAALILTATAYDVLVQHVLSRQASSNEKGTNTKGVVNGAFEHPVSVIKDTENGYLDRTDKEDFTNKNKNTNDQREPQVSAYRPGIPGRLLISFSVYTNAPKILNTNQPKGSLTCVNGIRFLSMTWVILGHTVSMGIAQLGLNTNSSVIVFTKW